MLKGLRKVASITLAFAVGVGFQVFAFAPQQAQAALGVWPGDAAWTRISQGGIVLADEEARAGCVDSTNGGTSVSPSEVDIGSQAVCSGPTQYNPGTTQPGATIDNTWSAGFLYDDASSNSYQCSNISDDFIYFRVRLAGDPMQNNASNGLKNSYWWTALDVDGDAAVDFYLRIDGNGNLASETITLIYETSGDSDPTGEPIVATHANPLTGGYVRVVATPDNGTFGDTNEFWLDWQLPVTEFDDNTGAQVICSGMTFAITNMTTSENGSNPFQKDQLLSTGTSDPLPTGYDYSITKTATDLNGATLLIGEPVQYDITVTNLGDIMTNFSLTDTLPAGSAYVASSLDLTGCSGCTGDVTAGILTVTAPSLAISEVMTISLQVTFAAVGTYANQAIGTTTQLEDDMYSDDPADDDDVDCQDNAVYNCNDQDTGNDDPTIVVVVDPPVGGSEEADLEVAKSASNPTPTEGATEVWTVSLHNAGPDATTGVVMGDLLPATVTYVSHLTAAGTYDSVTGVWSVGAMAIDQTVTLTITTTVNSGTANTTITNTATVTAQDLADPDPSDNTASATVTVGTVVGQSQNADIEIAKTVNNPAPRVGDPIAFTITAHNAGPAAATSITVGDVMPTGLTYISHVASQGSYNPTTGAWTIGSMANAATVTLTVTATVSSTAAGQAITNTACVTGAGQADPDSTDNCAAATVTIPQVTGSQVTNYPNNATGTLVETGVGAGLSVMVGIMMLSALFVLRTKRQEDDLALVEGLNVVCLVPDACPEHHGHA